MPTAERFNRNTRRYEVIDTSTGAVLSQSDTPSQGPVALGGGGSQTPGPFDTPAESALLPAPSKPDDSARSMLPGAPPPPPSSRPFRYQGNQIIPGQSPQPRNQGEAAVNTLLFGDSDAPTWGDVPFSTDWFRDRGADIGNLGVGIAEGVRNWWNAPPGGAPAPTPQAAPAPTQTPIDFGQPEGYLPRDETRLQQLRDLLPMIGQVPDIQAPQLPPAVQQTVDPAFEYLEDHASRRQGQTDELIAERRASIEERRERANNKWLLFGRWLGEVAATNDITQAGAIMANLIQQDQDLLLDLEEEATNLISLGWTAEDAVVEATSRRLSGQHSVESSNAQARDQRAVQQVDIDHRTGLARIDAESRATGARANVLSSIIDAEYEAGTRADERYRQGVAPFTNIPGYELPAYEALAPETLPPEGRSVWANEAVDQQTTQGLLMSITAGLQQENKGPLLALLRQFNPAIQQRDLNNSTPEQLLMLAMTGPNARQALRSNPQLREALRYMPQGAPSAPAQ